MDIQSNGSCRGFPSSSSTSSKSLTNFPCGKHSPTKPPSEEEAVCPTISQTTTSSSTTVSMGYFDNECRLTQKDKRAPNIAYEVAIAKSIMQQYSTISGDNLFDHLSDIIKRVIDERPPNIIDFFEEFSRNVREQKFHLPERFPPDGIFEETRIYRVAKRQLISMRLPTNEECQADLLDEDIPGEQSIYADELKLDIIGAAHLFKTFNERVQQLQFYWNQCGFSISTDDIFQLACAMTRLQVHPAIMQCRFWGVINGLKASYYIVEASLTVAEIENRLEQMREELIEQREAQLASMRNPYRPPPNIGDELIPGAMGWENWPSDEIIKMTPPAAPVPLIKVIEVFDIPPEPIGLGTNRYSYFVVNSLSDEWIELPIVTPKQIVISRQIKKFMTGDLESEIAAIPCFPGKEKHYLRAMISRITAGTYIAPHSYYRKMTKREKRLYDGIGDDEMEEEAEEEEDDFGEGEEEETDNDIILLKNEKYEPLPLPSICSPSSWVHVRPNILNQGRIVWFDEEKARKERERELARLLKLAMGEEMGEEEEELEDEEAEAEGEGEEEMEMLDRREIGPTILTVCSEDASDQFTVPWVGRLTSTYTNKNERVLVMRSNTWPGAYTFTFDKVCESIYMGWGHKYVARNMAFTHLAAVLEEFPHASGDFTEATDPTPEDEEAYRLALLRRQQRDIYDGEDLEELDDLEGDAGSDN